jgi:purine-binding chemotaxis protein CheW
MDIQALEKDIAAEGEFSLEGVDFITDGDQYLTFQLGSEQYGVDILSVKEIRGWEKPTLIPNAPTHIKGVINIRGMIVPIIDLRIQFALGEAVYLPTTVVVVLSVNLEGKCRTMGYVVDAVSDVLNVGEEDIKSSPQFNGSVPRHYIEGLVNAGDNLVTLLNCKALQQIAEIKPR